MASVLIVDSNIAASAGIADYLSSLGFTIWRAQRGDEGLQVAIAKRPDLILLDGQMPDKTGLQMCTAFRKNPVTSTIPIILMSALAGFANQQVFARERGANEYISKPLRVIELGELVNQYIGPKLDDAESEPKHQAQSRPENPPSNPVPAVAPGQPISNDYKAYLRSRLRDAFAQQKTDPAL